MPLTTYFEEHLTPQNIQTFIKTTQAAIIEEITTHPFHILVEVIFILALIFMVFTPRKHHIARDEKLTKEEEEELLESFKSEKFAVPALPDPSWKAPMALRNEGLYSSIVDWKGEKFDKVVNVANFDFLALSTHPKMIEQACDTTVEYGIGSCGPRGFYGSLKPHIQLEQDVSAFLKTPSTIVFSCSFASPATVLPCFASRGDEVICDEACNVLNQHSCTLSRASVVYNRHCDVAHVEELMKQSHVRQKKTGKQLPRRWLVTEGLFRNTGEIAPVDKLVALAKKYKYRIVVDDNTAFGIIGKTGRGTPELFNVPLKDIDIYLGSFATAVGSVGGFCSGAEMVTDHQRLGSTGYVFSAAACAYSSTCASLAVKMLGDEKSEESKRPQKVQNLAKLFRSKIQVPSSLVLHGAGDAITSQHSPVIQIRTKADVSQVVTDNKDGGFTRFSKSSISFRRVEDAVLRRGYLVTRVEYNHEERITIPPSLRVNLKSEMTEQQVAELAAIVSEELKREFA